MTLEQVGDLDVPQYLILCKHADDVCKFKTKHIGL